MEFGSGAHLINNKEQESKEYELAENDDPLSGTKKYGKSEVPSYGTTDLNKAAALKFNS